MGSKAKSGGRRDRRSAAAAEAEAVAKADADAEQSDSDSSAAASSGSEDAPEVLSIPTEEPNAASTPVEDDDDDDGEGEGDTNMDGDHDDGSSSSSAPSSSSDDGSESDENMDDAAGDDDDDDDDDDAVDAIVVGPDGQLPPHVRAMLEKAQAAQRAAAAAVQPPAAPAPLISKSWAVRSCHAPCYTGGPVIPCSLLAPAEEEASPDAVTEDDGNADGADAASAPQPEQREVHSYLLTPCRGDLALVDVQRGVRITSLRAGPSIITPSEDEEEDDDDNLDRDAVVVFALSPNGRDLITASRDSILRVYNLQAVLEAKHPAVPRKTLGKGGHKLPVTSIGFHPSSVFFATGSVDGAVKIWDLRGGYATHQFYPSGGRGTSSSVSCVQWHPEMSKLVVGIGRDDGTICVHDLRPGDDATSRRSGSKGKGKKGGRHYDEDAPIAVLGDHVSAVTSLAWSGDGNTVFISAGRDAVINLWSVEETVGSGSPKKKRKKGKAGGAAAENDKAIVYRRVHTLPVYEQIEALVMLSPSYLPPSDSVPKLSQHDIVFATSGSGGKVRVWTSRRSGASDSSHSGGKYGALACLARQSLESAVGEKRGGYAGLVLSGGGARVEAGAEAGATGGQLVAIDAERNLSFLAPVAPPSRKQWEGGEMDDDAAHEARLVTDRTIVGHNDEILDLRLLPNSEGDGGERRLAVATNSPTVRIFASSPTSFSAQSALIGHTDTVLALDVSPCGRFVLTAGKDRSARLWSTSTSDCLATMEGHTESVGAACLSRKVGRYDVAGKAALKGEGAFAITGGRDKTVKKWALLGANELLAPTSAGDDEKGGGNNNNVRQVKAVHSVKAHDKDINVACSSPTDALIATGSQDKTIKLWNSSDLSPRGTLKGHKRGVWDVRFSPVDRVLASASGDRTIKLWSLAELRCVRTFQGHAESVLRVRFLSGGMQLLSGGADGLIKVWTVRSNECECTCDGHGDKVWALDVAEGGGGSGGNDNAEGGTFVSGGADSRLVVWRDTTAEIDSEKRAEEEKSILMEQKLANHLRNKEYGKALEVALELDKPLQALRVLENLIEDELKKKKGGDPLAALRSHVVSWVEKDEPASDKASAEDGKRRKKHQAIRAPKLIRMLKYCREWNTRARNSHIAALVVRATVSSVPVPTLASIEGAPEVLAGVVPYAERHFARLDGMYGETFLIDHCLGGMGCLDVAGALGGGDGAEDYQQWEAKSKPVLPPTSADGRVQVGGMDVVGLSTAEARKAKADGGGSSDDSSDESGSEGSGDEVVTIGDSDTESGSEGSSESD